MFDLSTEKLVCRMAGLGHFIVCASLCGPQLVSETRLSGAGEFVQRELSPTPAC